jgi:hypothetical protein
VVGAFEDTAGSLSMRKQGLYATTGALGLFPGVAQSAPMAVALYPFPGAPGLPRKHFVFISISGQNKQDEPDNHVNPVKKLRKRCFLRFF